MKKLLALFFALTLLLTACGKTAEPSDSQIRKVILNPAEYVLYQNIFYNKTGNDYVGQEQTKTGILAVIHDSWKQVTRYYVWGYNDQTKCCDWQWEFVPADPGSLPNAGSAVKVTGIFAYDEAALDHYWLTNAAVKLDSPLEASGTDYDLTTMSDTLERVQIYNIRQFPEEYEGKTIRAYGRIAGPGSIEDSYYNGSWIQAFTSSDTLPAIGTMVILEGVCKNGIISDCTITPTGDY